jgi:hypothetical protein
MLEDEESESDEGEFSDAVGPDPSAVVNGEGDTAGDTVDIVDMPVPATEVDKATKSLIAKMRENAYEARRKKIELQELNLTKLWPFVTSQMSSASLAKVREFSGYEDAKASRDVIKLWRFIRRSHLTHVYGQSDNLRAVNINDQLIRFGNLRQGQHETLSDFKTRYDNQVKANQGVGVVNTDESLVAIDFLSKLDPKRFTSLLTVLRNNAAINIDTYPKTLAGAYRAASTWTSEGLILATRETHSAFVTDKTKEKTKASKGKPPKGGPDEKEKSSSSTKSDIECYICGKIGHYCSNCPDRKQRDMALVAHEDSGYSDEDSEEDGKEVAFVTSETVLFAGHALMLDSQSSTSVVFDQSLLNEGSIRRAEKGIILNGVDKSSPGIHVDLVGELCDIGTVYYCPTASANILSFAAMTDSGADIRYTAKHDRFTMKPKGSATVAENMRKYTKREVESAGAARELLARMGYPSVENAIVMIRGGDNMKVTERDFRVAHDIWGKDVTSMRGKTKKKSTAVADISIRAPVIQKQQVLSVDIMFVDSIPSLVAVANAP